MKVSDLMTRRVRSCSVHDDLGRAAQIMWESDCGAVPIVDDDERVVGMLTDRDVCMAGYTQGKAFTDIPVAMAMAKKIFTIGENDALEAAEALMSDKQIRRLPVVDGAGRLRGIVSINDLARHAHVARGRRGDELSGDTIAQTLAAIGAPHHPAHAAAPAE